MKTIKVEVSGHPGAPAVSAGELHTGELHTCVSEPEPGAFDLATVLHALSDPLRLQIVVQLAGGEERTCGSFGLPITKSTSSHHFRVLREAGVISQRAEGKCRLNHLRREELEHRFPGLIDAVLRAYAA